MGSSVALGGGGALLQGPPSRTLYPADLPWDLAGA